MPERGEAVRLTTAIRKRRDRHLSNGLAMPLSRNDDEQPTTDAHGLVEYHALRIMDVTCTYQSLVAVLV